MKKRLSLLIILLVILNSLSALSREIIYYSDNSLLTSMAESRGIDTSLSPDEIRNRLYAYYNFEKVEMSSETVEEDGEYTLEIVSADSLSSDDHTFTLKGNVIIDFISSSGEKKRLTASTIVIDTEKKIITSLGHSSYVDNSEKAAIKEIEADILTVKWEEGDISITGGTTTTERENSEKKKVNFFTSGERLNYLDEGAIIFDDGYITSNPKNAYSSISASSILILPGQDMFLSNATFNIGRVPIFYLPFFFFPGSKILGNPSFGFSSAKGAFLNTSFELIGTYGKLSDVDESSSFSSLLKSTDSTGTAVREGYYYKESEEELSTLDKFAKDTKSYLVLLVDSYSGGKDATLITKGGVHVGLDGVLNLFDNKLKLNIFTGLATPIDTLSKELRYYGKNSLSFSSWGLNFSIDYPFYSDSTVLYHYGNRLTGFSYGPLMGETSTFPQDYSPSGITSFTRSLKLTYSLPSSIKIPFVSSFSVKNLSVEGNYSLTNSPDKDKRTILTSYSQPTLSLSLSGTVLSLDSSSLKKKADTKTEETKETREETTEKSGETVEKEKEKSILLVEPYVKAAQASTTASSSSSSKFTLSYSITEDLNRAVTNDTSSGEKKSGKNTSTTYTKVSANGNLGKIITISDTYTNSISYTENLDYAKETWTKKTTLNPLNAFSVSIPYLGLTYNLSIKPYNYTEETTESTEKTTEKSTFEFTKDYVKTHSLVFSKTLSTPVGKFSGDITYNLPPIESSITPVLKWSKNSFSSTLSWLFKEDDGTFKKDLLKLILSYSSSYFNLSSTFNYRTNELEEGVETFAPLTYTGTFRVQSKDKKYYLEETLNGDGEIEGFITTAKTSLQLNSVNLTLTRGRNSDYEMENQSFNMTTNIKSASFQLWKGRIYFSFGLDSTLFLNFQEKVRSYLTLTPNIVISVASFLDFKFSFKTQNNKLSSYVIDDKFSLSSAWEDLKRSFDFVSDGRLNTSFIMQNISLEVVHYMDDWNLNAKYTTSFVKGSDSGKTVYKLQPSLSIYLSWNTMPDLKAEENWYQDFSGEWKKK